MTKTESNPNNEQNEQNQSPTQTGRIWSCNHELSAAKGFHTEIDSEISSELAKMAGDKSIHTFQDTYFTVYYIDYKDLYSKGYSIFSRYFYYYLYETFHFSEQLDLAS